MFFGNDNGKCCNFIIHAYVCILYVGLISAHKLNFCPTNWRKPISQRFVKWREREGGRKREREGGGERGNEGEDEEKR